MYRIAQSELGEIVYVDLPEVGKSFKQDDIFGSVEAVKTTSDLFTPISGEVIEVNTSLKENVALVNTASFSEGWMIKFKISNPEELNNLLSAEQYKQIAR